MNRPGLTESQHLAVTTVGSDVSVLAGAGTGKTHVLTQRVLRRIVEEESLELRSLLAITFTEKAATEMKHRIAGALVEAGVANAREEVDAAAISTIHSFCARLLRDHAIDAAVDPAFRVLDELEATALVEEAARTVLPRVRDRDPQRFALLSRLPGLDPAESLLALHRAARDASVEGAAAHVRRLPELPPLRNAVVRVHALLAEALPVGRAGTAKSEELANAIALAAEPGPASTADDHEGGLAVLEWSRRVSASIRLNTTKDFKALLGPLREACDELAGIAAEWVLMPLRSALADTLDELDDEYERLRGRGAALDFRDLELRAVALLRDVPEVREQVRARRPEVFVDEFQDVSPLQAELVELVRTPGRTFLVGDPKQSIYGFRGSDVDIFVRRHGEVARDGAGAITLSDSFRTRPEVLAFVNRVFAGVRHGTEGDGIAFEPLAAGRTFGETTRPAIELALFPEETTADARRVEARWIATRIRRLVEGHGDVPPLQVSAPTPDDPTATRPATYGDVAVLLRATTGIKELERALAAEEVPYLVLKGRGFFSASEVVDLAYLLECVAQPVDDLALATVLRSPACELDDDALFLLTRARRLPGAKEPRPLVRVVDDWFAAPDEAATPKLPAEAARRLRRFWTVFLELRGARAVRPLTELVDLALDATELEYRALVRPNGRQRLANLRKVRALAREADASGDGDLRRFAARLRSLREREVRETEAAVTSGDLGAVGILTVHAAKGLEWPIVFVPELTRVSRATSDRMLCDAELGTGLHSAELPDGVRTVSWSRIAARTDARAAEEAERLLYVALTRPRDHLVLTGGRLERSRGRQDWWERVAPAIGLSGPPEETGEWTIAVDDGVSLSRTVVLVHAPGEEDASGDGAGGGGRLVGPSALLADLRTGRPPPFPDEPERARLAPLARVWTGDLPGRPPAARGSLFTASVSALVAFARCPEEFRRRHVLGLPEPASFTLPQASPVADDMAGGAALPGVDDEWDAPPSALLLGRAVHRALELLVPEFAGDTRAVVERALRRELGGMGAADDEIERLTGWVEGFRASPLGERVAGVTRALVRREQGFAWQLGETVIRGALDLVFRGEDGWVVVDYKTADFDRAAPESALQMQLYALALEAITGAVPAEALLVSLPRSRVIAVDISERALSRVRDEVVDPFLSRTAAADYGWGTSPPCARCAYRTVCPGAEQA